MSHTVEHDIAQNVMHLRINRPEKKNALTTDMYTVLADAVDAAREDDNVRCLLLTGADGVFSAGNDIGDFLEHPVSGDDHPIARFMRAMAAFPKPAVAGVVGPAVGIGSTVLLHCDLVYAGASTRFAFPFVNLGICPEFASSYLMPRFMGYARAAELILLGDPFTAEHALSCGLINAVVDDGEAETIARATAEKLAAKPPHAVRTSKDLLRRWSRGSTQQAIREEAELFMAMLHGDEAKEAFTAFMEKRKPDFSRFS